MDQEYRPNERHRSMLPHGKKWVGLDSPSGEEKQGRMELLESQEGKAKKRGIEIDYMRDPF